jgi:O-antigen/teichoic acid export membrane protein
MNQTWVKYLPPFIRGKVQERPSLQKVLGNTGWMMGDQVVRKALGLLIGVLIARHFGPRLYGEFSYAVAVVMIVSPIAMLSLDDIAIRSLARDSSRKDEILGSSFVLMLVGGFLAFAMALLAIFVARPDSSLVQWLVGILAAGSVAQAFIAIEFWFEAQMQWKYTVFAKTSAFVLLSLVKIGLILLQAPLVAFAWAGLAEIALGSIGLWLVYRQRGYRISAWRFRRVTAQSLLRDSWPLMLSAILTMVYLRIDQVMLGNMIGYAKLGNYSVAVQLSEVWVFIPMVIVSSVLPAFVEVEKDNEELFFAHLQRLYRIMTLYAYLVALPITLFAKPIIGLLYSSAYLDAAPLVVVLIWAGVFTSLGVARNILIIVKNWTRVNLLSVALGGALNILLNLMLIPRYGDMGAVAATIVSYWFAVHGTCFLFKPLRSTGVMMTRAIFYPKAW